MSDDFPKEKADFRSKLRDVPHKPGVYLMRDRLNRVIYVGKARDLRKRLSQYFTPSKKTMGDRKTRALIESIWDFEFQTVRNEPESLLLEGKLIKEWRPKYNVSFRDDKRFLLLKVHFDDPFPRFHLSRVRKEDGARYFGPFAHSGALRSTLDWMTKHFGLRSCRPLRPGEQDYKHCNDDVIKNCTAPCIGHITPEDYRERVEAACAFLEGRSKEMLSKLEIDMQKAAAALNFERAAQLRDMLDNLKKTLSPARRFTRKRGLPESNKEAALADVQDLAEALHLERPPLIMECFDISNISTTHCVASMVRFKDGEPNNQNYRRYRIKGVDGQDDFASMAEVVRRRYARVLLHANDEEGDRVQESQESVLELMRRLAKESNSKKFVTLPDLVIVDGGKGQLSSAYKELKRLGLHELPIIGLAKEHEEIYRPGDAQPIRLSHSRGGLKLLQRIRDEAHRFANGYHQLLLKRRVAESILDDCPGISKRRKQLLLKHFGSVARLRKANAEAIAELPGISLTLAQDLLRFLDSHREN